MQAFKNNEFRLINAGLSPKETYDSIKGAINNICNHIERVLVKHKEHDSFAISIILSQDPKLHGIFYAHCGQVDFFVWDNNKLYSEYPISAFKLFINSDMGGVIAKRCYEQTRMILEGKIQKYTLVSEEVASALNKTLGLKL